MTNIWRKPFDSEIKAAPPAKVSLDKNKCKGCGYCTEFCPRDVLAMSQEFNAKGYNAAEVVDESKCLACGLCEIICPEFTIKVNRKDKES
jgi:2-oxoglutarate ferredoxin oxidoreductase subunit delta